MAVDPSYPLFPIASTLCSALLFLVLGTSFMHQSWNLGVAALCFWLFLENLTGGVNAILWVDNAEVKAKVYCDIGTPIPTYNTLAAEQFLVTHLQMFAYIVRPACSLVITRRLYKIASRRSVTDMLRREEVSLF